MPYRIDTKSLLNGAVTQGTNKYHNYDDAHNIAKVLNKRNKGITTHTVVKISKQG